MLQFTKHAKRVWTLHRVDENGANEFVAEFRFKVSSITNKFEIVAKVFEEVSKEIPEFEDWYIECLSEYSSSFDSQYLLERAPQFLDYARRYIELMDYDFDRFYDEKKVSSTSVVFESEDITALAISSTALKFFSPFVYDQRLEVPKNLYNEIYQILIGPCIQRNVMDKIFQLIRSRVYRSNITDRYMWELIKILLSETPESYVMMIFNFLMKNMMITINVDRNPITYFVSLIDDSIRWMMRTVFKEKMIYGEQFASTGDIHGSSVSKDSFYIYCCNDVISKAALAAMNLIENEYGVDENSYLEVKDRLERIDYLNPILKLVALPIASRVLDIPYKYLIRSIPKHATLLGILMHYCGNHTNEFCRRFPIIHSFLEMVPKEDSSYLTVNSSYKIKNISEILNDDTKMFGFSSRTLKYDTLSTICGVLINSRKDVVSLITGKPMKRFTNAEFERDVIRFYRELFSGQLDHLFATMQQRVDEVL